MVHTHDIDNMWIHLNSHCSLLNLFFSLFNCSKKTISDLESGSVVLWTLNNQDEKLTMLVEENWLLHFFWSLWWMWQKVILSVWTCLLQRHIKIYPLQPEHSFLINSCLIKNIRCPKNSRYIVLYHILHIQ